MGIDTNIHASTTSEPTGIDPGGAPDAPMSAPAGSATDTAAPYSADTIGDMVNKFNHQFPTLALDNPPHKPPTGNNWFGGALVMYTMITMQIALVNKRMGFMESQTAIKSRQGMYDETKAKAEDQKALAALQAMGKIYEAITQATEGVMAGVSLIGQARNESAARERAKNLEPDIEKKTKLFEEANGALKTHKANAAANKASGNIELTDMSDGKTQTQRDTEKLTEARDAARDNMNSAQTLYDQKYNAVLTSKNDTLRSYVTIFTSAQKSVMSVLGATLATKEGDIQARMTMEDGYIQQYSKNYDNAKTFDQSSKQSLESIFSTLKGYQDTHGGRV